MEIVVSFESGLPGILAVSKDRVGICGPGHHQQEDVPQALDALVYKLASDCIQNFPEKADDA